MFQYTQIIMLRTEKKSIPFQNQSVSNSNLQNSDYSIKDSKSIKNPSQSSEYINNDPNQLGHLTNQKKVSMATTEDIKQEHATNTKPEKRLKGGQKEQPKKAIEQIGTQPTTGVDMNSNNKDCVPGTSQNLVPRSKRNMEDIYRYSIEDTFPRRSKKQSNNSNGQEDQDEDINHIPIALMWLAVFFYALCLLPIDMITVLLIGLALLIFIVFKALFYTFFIQLTKKCRGKGSACQKAIFILGSILIFPMWFYCIQIEMKVLFHPKWQQWWQVELLFYFFHKTRKFIR